MSAIQELPQSDFARFWYVGTRLVAQRAADFGIHIALPPNFTSIFTLDILSPASHPELIWLYPPTMGLLAMLFSCLPLWLSFWAWRGVSLIVAAACWRYARLSWPVIVMGLASTAALHDAVGGQNGVFMAGFYVAGLLCFETRPRFSGFAAGLLSLKPQLAVALPMILLNRRYFPALLVCLLTGLTLVALSILAEGWHSWIWFFTVSEPNATRILNAPASHLVPGGYTVLMMARSLHASLAVAWAVQLTFTVIAAFFIWRAWCQAEADPIARMAVTASLALLLSPYGYIYDLVSFSVAMAAMCSRAAHRWPLFALLWLAGGYTITLENLTGVIFMPFAAIAGATLSWHYMRTRPATTTNRNTRPEPR
ncbi:MAG: DUF2029 domain-containing protein [Rhodospirillales bacterium]|nr:DUF2029 domain-containing protein [Rhodospirillales bacterium]